MSQARLSAEQVESRTRELLWDLVKKRTTVQDIHAMLPGHVFAPTRSPSTT
jgi:hypothetical protein